MQKSHGNENARKGNDLMRKQNTRNKPRGNSEEQSLTARNRKATA